MVAEVLRQAPLDDRLDTKDGDRDILVQAFASRFYQDNERFDSSRFDAAVFRGELTHRSHSRGGWHKSDYEMIADVIRESIASDAAKAVVAQGFADRFYYDNSNFKEDIFFRRIFGADYQSRTYVWSNAREEGYLGPGDDPSMPGGGPPVYHGPEERYGGRRVRVRKHLRSKPGGRVKRVRVRAHNREV